MAANPDRRIWWIQNLSVGDLWINDIGGDAAAVQPSFKVPPGATYESIREFPTDARISIFGATTGQAFAAREC